jgi:hypothetical protein
LKYFFILLPSTPRGKGWGWGLVSLKILNIKDLLLSLLFVNVTSTAFAQNPYEE